MPDVFFIMNDSFLWPLINSERNLYNIPPGWIAVILAFFLSSLIARLLFSGVPGEGLCTGCCSNLF